MFPPTLHVMTKKATTVTAWKVANIVMYLMQMVRVYSNMSGAARKGELQNLPLTIESLSNHDDDGN